MAAIKRYDRQYYLNVGDADKPVWAIVGEGFLRFEEKKNAKTVYRRYFHAEDIIGDNEGYSAEIIYEAEVVKGSPTICKISEITNREQTGACAVVDVLAVDRFDDGGLPGAYKAYLRSYSVIPDSVGEGGEALRISGRLVANGEIRVGQYISSEGEFTL